MAGFDAGTIKQETYDFRPFADVSGVIPEPSSNQIDAYRSAIIAAVKGLGVTSDEVGGASGNAAEMLKHFTMDRMVDLMGKSREVENATLDATADLVGLDRQMLRDLPYRVAQAFAGYIMGLFFNPEA